MSGKEPHIGLVAEPWCAKITLIYKRRLITLKSTYPWKTLFNYNHENKHPHINSHKHFAMSHSELAVSYAALILADDDVDITVSAEHGLMWCWKMLT